MTDETLYALHRQAMRRSAQTRRLHRKRGNSKPYGTFWRLDRAICREYRRRVDSRQQAQGSCPP